MKVDIENPQAVLEDILTRINKGELAAVVRCKDCKWYSKYCGCDKVTGLVGANEDSYCSRGERKEKTDAEEIH